MIKIQGKMKGLYMVVNGNVNSDFKRPNEEEPLVLSKAVLNAAEALGMSNADLDHVLGTDTSGIKLGLDPDSESGIWAIHLIRCYLNLLRLVGNDAESIIHWMTTYNHHLLGIPSELIQTNQGLIHTEAYLDSMLNKA